MKTEAIKARVKALSDLELVEMAGIKSGDYTPEAVEIAREEIAARGGLDHLKDRILKDKKMSAVLAISETNQEAAPKATAKDGKAATKKIIQIGRLDSTIEYEDFGKLHTDILKGFYRKDENARIVVKSIPEKKEAKKEPKWSSLEKVSQIDFKLRTLYQPIWAHTMKACGIGVIIGIILKAIDTTYTFFNINEKLGLLWLAVLASMVFIKWIPWAPFLLIVVLIVAKAGNLWMSWLAVMAVGAIFGAPGGMAVGTIIGHFKKDRCPRAMDAEPEGAKPYITGLLIPLVFLTVMLPLYIFWFTPLIMEWLSRR